MLGAYLASIVIYLMILYGMLYIFADKIKDNHWIDVSSNGTGNRTAKNWRVSLVCIAAIPVFRILIVLCLIYMSVHTKEDFEEFKNEHKQ